MHMPTYFMLGTGPNDPALKIFDTYGIQKPSLNGHADVSRVSDSSQS